MLKYLFTLLIVCFSLQAADIAVVTMVIGEKYANAVAIGTNNKQQYCKKHGYDFYCFTEQLDKSRPIAWSKILCVQQVLQTNKYKWVFWTDADSIIMQTDQKLEYLIDNNYNIIISDPGKVLNTGQFLIRNCSRSKELLNRIYGFSQFINHDWWEQMAFIHEYVNNLETQKYTKIIDPYFLNSFAHHHEFNFDDFYTAYRPGSFIIHFAAVRNADQLKELMNNYSRYIQ